MLKVGDLVVHKTTGQSGKVFGYGHQIVGGVYLPTLTVRVVEGTGIYRGSFVEDLSSNWLPIESEKIPEFKIGDRGNKNPLSSARFGSQLYQT